MQRIAEVSKDYAVRAHSEAIAFIAMACVLIIAPAFAYPVFLMKALCFALFACAFNLLIGYVGLLSFGHALFFGWASYVSPHAAKVWGFPPEFAILVGAGVRKQLWSLGPERRNAPVFSPPLGVGLTRKRSERPDS